MRSQSKSKERDSDLRIALHKIEDLIFDLTSLNRRLKKQGLTEAIELLDKARALLHAEQKG